MIGYKVFIGALVMGVCVFSGIIMVGYDAGYRFGDPQFWEKAGHLAANFGGPLLACSAMMVVAYTASLQRIAFEQDMDLRRVELDLRTIERMEEGIKDARRNGGVTYSQIEDRICEYVEAIAVYQGNHYNQKTGGDQWFHYIKNHSYRARELAALCPNNAVLQRSLKKLQNDAGGSSEQASPPSTWIRRMISSLPFRRGSE